MPSAAPKLLLNLMGVFASLTGLLGFLANGAAICLFCRASKVSCAEKVYQWNIFMEFINLYSLT